MTDSKFVFNQLFEPIHAQVFARCVHRYRGDDKVISFSCWDQFLAMAFAQLTFRESLRDIEACLRSQGERLYHLGFRGRISRSTLADANEIRDWRIYADLAAKLIARARKLYADDPFELDLDETVYALDATTIDLCLKLFPWANFRKTKAAVKMHTLLDLRGSIPTFIQITAGKVHDVNALDELIIEPGAYYIMDRGYLDFARLFVIDSNQGYFVIRAKKNLDFVRHRSQPLDSVQRESGVRSDHIGRLGGDRSVEAYPELLRRVRYYDEDTQRFFVYLTNNMALEANVIAKLYKKRWQIELFFKWIKQHLRIKAFFGTSANAVKTQIWIAICVYLLVAILKKELKLPGSLHRILQVLSVSPFEQVPLNELLTESAHRNQPTHPDNQLTFWDL